MVDYNFKFLNDIELHEIQDLHISCDQFFAELEIVYYRSYPLPPLMIEYRQDGKDTSVTDKTTKQCVTLYDTELLDVLCSNLAIILKNQVVPFRILLIHQFYYGFCHCQNEKSKLPPRIAFDKLCDFIARHKKLPVRYLIMDPTGMQQLSDVLSALNSKMLRTVEVCLKHTDESVTMKQLLEMVEKKIAAPPCCLHVRKKDATFEDITEMKEVLFKSATLSGVHLFYENIDDKHIGQIFDKTGSIPDDAHEFYFECTNRFCDSRERPVVGVQVCRQELNIHRSMYHFQNDYLLDKDWEELLGGVDLSSSFEMLFCKGSDNAMQVFQNKLIMDIILKTLSVFEIQAFRRVSRGIKDTIDNVYKISNIYDINIFAQDNDAHVEIWCEQRRYRCFFYTTENKQSRCDITFVTPDPCSKAVEDLSGYFQQQSFTLGKLEMIGNNVKYLLDKLEYYLRSREELLEVENLEISAWHQEHVMRLLQYLKPKTLKAIEIMFPRKDIDFELDEIVKLEQYKQAKMFTMRRTTLPAITRIIQDIARASFLVSSIDEEEIFHLKEELLKSSKLIKCKIEYSQSSVNESSFDLLGAPHFRPGDLMFNVRKTWYYQHTEVDKALLVLLYTEKKLVTFTRVDIDAIPGDVIL